jgi:hypothetical protein
MSLLFKIYYCIVAVNRNETKPNQTKTNQTEIIGIDQIIIIIMISFVYKI